MTGHSWQRRDTTMRLKDGDRTFTYWECPICGGFWAGDDEPNGDVLAPCVPKAEQAAAINNRPHTPLHIVMLHKTCDAVPSQWEGLASDGRCVYIRYRGGRGYVGAADTLDDAIGDENEQFVWYGEDAMDGYMSFSDLVHIVPSWITFEDGIDDAFDDDLQSAIQAVSDLRRTEIGSRLWDQQHAAPTGWVAVGVQDVPENDVAATQQAGERAETDSAREGRDQANPVD